MRYDSTIHTDQFPFQFANAAQYSTGPRRILNVGCNTDGAGLGKYLGAINVDLHLVDAATGDQLPVDVLSDARELDYNEEFDVVVLGEILEHMEPHDAVCALRCSYNALVPGGCVVITMPHDTRRDGGDVPKPDADKEWYAPGVYAYHYRSIGLSELFSWLAQCGFELQSHARIHYLWGEKGSGVVAIKPKPLSSLQTEKAVN